MTLPPCLVGKKGYTIVSISSLERQSDVSTLQFSYGHFAGESPCSARYVRRFCSVGSSSSDRATALVWSRIMTIDKSLKIKKGVSRSRNVLTRVERIEKLQSQERWTDEASPLGLPKVRVYKIVLKKKKKALFII